MPPWNPLPKPTPATAVPSEEHGRGAEVDADERHGHTGDQGRDADTHDRAGVDGPQQVDRRGRDPGEHEEAQPAEHERLEPETCRTRAGPSAP